MNDKPPIPPLHAINPPFPDMNGARILVQRGGASEIGTIVCYHKGGLFGIRIAVMKPPVFDYPLKPPSTDDWETCGHISVVSLSLSEGAIRSIRQADSSDFDFVFG